MKLHEFYRDYANWEGLRAVCLTFDIDFAPDYMIEPVLDLLSRHGAHATFYATHHSTLLERIRSEGIHEVGIHPNLSAGSTQGRNLDEILDALTAAVPGVIGNRFHVLGHSYRDLVQLGRRGFLYDVSALRYNCPYLLPAWHPDLGMVLFTYSWEDGICENSGLPMTLGSIDLTSPGMKVLNFHPMNVWVNGPAADQRLMFLRDNPDLRNCRREIAEGYRHDGPGAGKMLRDLLGHLKGRGTRFVRMGEAAAAFRESAQ